MYHLFTDTNALAKAANVLLYKILLFNLHDDLALSCIFDPTKSIDVVSPPTKPILTFGACNTNSSCAPIVTFFLELKYHHSYW